MIFLGGSTMLGVDELSISYTPTNVNGIKRVEMRGAWFNDLFVWGQDGDPEGVMPEPFIYQTDKDGNYVLDDDGNKKIMSSPIPDDWDYNFIMRAHYEDSTMAGNVDWRVEDLYYTIIKRKKLPNGTYKETDENKWITLKVNQLWDVPLDERYQCVNIRGVDMTAGSGKYVYAIVPIFEGGVEGAYCEINEPLEVTINKLVIVDKDEVWSTIFVDDGFSIQHVMPSSPIETMYNRYPTIISNGDANYRTVTVDAKWLPLDKNCGFDAMDDDIIRVEYNDRFLAFLHNKNAKILKAVNGRLFFIWITTPASISIEESDILEKVSFGGTEIGSVYDEELLYKTGFTNVTSEWWFK